MDLSVAVTVRWFAELTQVFCSHRVLRAASAVSPPSCLGDEGCFIAEVWGTGTA